MAFSNNTTYTCNSATIVLVYFFPKQLFLLNAELMMQPILIQALAIIIRCIYFPCFSFAESSPHDLQITAYK